MIMEYLMPGTGDIATNVWHSWQLNNTTSNSYGTVGTGGDVWGGWCQSYSSGSGLTIETTGNGVWPLWCKSYGTAASISSGVSIIWKSWVKYSNGYVTEYQQVLPATSGGATAPLPAFNPIPIFEAPKETEEARSARLASEAALAAIRRAEEERRRQDKEAAESRARKLLLENLLPKQIEDFERNKTFIVQAASGRRYRIKLGWGGNIEELDAQARIINRFCIHPRDTIPEHDNVLAQKLVIEGDEEFFLKTANRTEIRQPASVN